MAKPTKSPGGLKTRVQGGYRQYWDPKTGRWRRTHRRVIEKRLGPAAKALEVHHLDLDRLNNRPRNLVGLTPAMHARIHEEPAACFRCGRAGHQAAGCKRKTDYQGRLI